MNDIIVYTQRVEIVENYNERRDCADRRIADFIYCCGFLPLPLPNNPDIATEIVRRINPVGIVLTGGNSLVKYGGNAPDRDQTDSALIKLAIADRRPIFGFCRGMQSILEYFGNELVNVQGHVGINHVVRQVVGKEEKCFITNSFHNQGCMHVITDELIPEMTSDDGLVEMVRHRELPILGIMWHPEREKEFKDRDIELFTNLMGGK